MKNIDIRRARTLPFIGALTLMVLLAMNPVASASPNKTYPYEEYWLRNTLTTVFDASTPAANPFPNVVSDATLDNYFADKAKEPGNSPSEHTYKTVRVTYKDGKQATISSSYENMMDVAKVDIFLVFQPQVGTKDWEYNRTSFSARGGAFVAERTEDGGLTSTKYERCTTTAVFNGMTQHPVVSRGDDERQGEPVIGMYEANGRQYMQFTIEFPKNYTVGLVSMYFPKDTRNSQGNHVQTSLSRIELTHKPQVDFHFVDDFAYRGLLPELVDQNKPEALPNNAISPASPLAQRSEGTPIYSTAAFSKRLQQNGNPLIDLTEEPVSETAYFYLVPNGNKKELHAPLLRPDRLSEQDMEGVLKNTQTALTVKSSDFGTGKYFSDKERSTTFNTLKETHIPGYVYIDNDIDKKPDGTSYAERGNWLISLAMNDEGKLLDHKHYYLTYRPIPSRVKIHKSDAATQKSLAGATFDLFAKLPDGKEMPVRKNVTTDASGNIQLGDPNVDMDYLRNLVKQPQAVTEWYRNIYLDPTKTGLDQVFLMPGTYVLRETTAPQGYKKAEKDIEFTVPRDTKELGHVISVEVTNEPSPKPTPTPTVPAPEPTPTPTDTAPEPTPTTPMPKPTLPIPPKPPKTGDGEPAPLGAAGVTLGTISQVRAARRFLR